MKLDYQETETEKLDSQILGENLRRLQVIGLVGLPVNAILLAISAIRSGIAGLAEPVSILRICWIVATFGYFAVSGFIRGVERPGKGHSFAFTLASMLCCLFASGITVYNVSQDTATLVYIVVVLLIGAFLFLDSASFMIIVVPGLVTLYVGLFSKTIEPSRLIAVLVNVTALHFFAGVLALFNMKMKERQFESERALNRLNNELKALSERDGLTGLPNRRKIEETIEFWKAVFARKPDSLAIILIDVDFFKEYNEARGHLAGDDALKAIASLITNCLYREADFVGRYKGEQFVVILPGISRLGAFTIAERIRLAVQDARLLYEGKQSKTLTVSVGAAFSEMCSREAFDPLTSLADMSLSEAKKNGRNNVVIQDIF